MSDHPRRRHPSVGLARHAWTPVPGERGEGDYSPRMDLGGQEGSGPPVVPSESLSAGWTEAVRVAMAQWKIYQGRNRKWWAEPLEPSKCPYAACQQRTHHHRHLLTEEGDITFVTEVFNEALRGWERALSVAE